MSTPMAEPEPFVLHINPSAAPQLMHSTHEPADFEPLVLQLGQSKAAPSAVQIKPSDSAPPPHHASAGTLNLKVVEPILLHINSLSPLLSQINNHNPSSPQPQPSPPTPPPAGAQTEQLGSTQITNSNKIKNKHQKVLSTAGSLANLLPTGTVLAFQALTPSLSYNGRCHEFNKYLVAFVILVCSVICFMSSFTDSLKAKTKSKVYYGIATSKGLLVFNNDKDNGDTDEMELLKEELKELQVKKTDFLHAFLSVLVFLIFAFSSSEVQGCYFPESRELEYSLVIYLPLVAGILSSSCSPFFPLSVEGLATLIDRFANNLG